LCGGRYKAYIHHPMTTPNKIGDPVVTQLYLLFTAGLPTSPEATSATFAYDTAVIATDNDPAITSSKLQTNLLAI
jgi:hypothetical protein